METSLESMSAGKVLKNLMLELLYPAVLGTVLFFALDVTGTLISTMAVWDSTAAPFDSLVLLKCLLLYVTVVFYGCDYVYIMLTREFRIKFFWYDCAFLVGLYITLVNLRIREKELTELPAAWFVAAVYLFFFALYWRWDWLERDNLKTKFKEQGLTENERAILTDEIDFYSDKVLRWEKRSLALLLPMTIVIWWLRDSAWASILLLAVLVVLTRSFYRVVRLKRRFAYEKSAVATSIAISTARP